MNYQEQRQTKVLKVLKARERATVLQLAYHLEWSIKTVRNAIQALKIRGMVDVVGKTRAANGTKAECIYCAVSKPENEIYFEPSHTPQMMRDFKNAIKGTPWAGFSAFL